MIPPRVSSLVVLLAATAALACSKEPPKPGGDGNEAGAAPTAEASAKGPAADARATIRELTGEYTTKVGTFFVPDHKDWEKVRWRGDDAKDGVGKGALTFVVGSDGRVRGETGEGGALGAAVLSGIVHEGRVTATLLRKVADDDGFTGTLEGTLEGDTLRGTMRLASAASHLVREGSFEAKRKP